MSHNTPPDARTQLQSSQFGIAAPAKAVPQPKVQAAFAAKPVAPPFKNAAPAFTKQPKAVVAVKPAKVVKVTPVRKRLHPALNAIRNH